MQFLSLESVQPYISSSSLSDLIWDTVSLWNTFEKQTLGIQLVRCVDSIPANIAEGFGRYHKKDKQKFFYNARGSVYEAQFWIEKAKRRSLIDEKEYTIMKKILDNLPKEINWLIKVTEDKLTI